MRAKGTDTKKKKKKTHNINTKNLKGDIVIDGTFIKMIFNDIMKTSFNMFENLDENSQKIKFTKTDLEVENPNSPLAVKEN